MKKIINKIFIVLAVTATASTFTSCNDWLDINKNPFAVERVEPDYLFSYAAISNSYNRYGGDMYIALTIGGQTIADGGFNNIGGGLWDEAMYSFGEYAFGNSWVCYYARVAENMNRAVNIAAAEGHDNKVAQCKILKAFAFYQLTMLFGDVPCSEALDIETYPEPKFDSQRDVLLYAAELLDEAIADVDLASDAIPGIVGYDIYYGGSMEQWLRTAKSLKLNILLTIYNKDQSIAPEIASLITENNFLEDNDDDWVFPFFSTAGNQNPTWRLNDRYGADNIEDGVASSYMFYAHNSVMNPMKQYNDPRIGQYFYKNVQGEYKSIETSEDLEIVTVGFPLTSPLNEKKVWNPTTPDVLLSYQEVQFTLAEIYAKGIGVSKNVAAAQTALNNAITASCEEWDVPEADITSFISSLPPLSGMSEDGMVEFINTQKWIDLMARPFEAFCNQRRTKIPVLTTPEEAAGVYGTKLFCRFQYPSRESGSNPNVPSPLPTITEPMWFQN